MKAFGGNSEDFRRRLMLYLDGALTREETREFLAEIQQSPECLGILQQEKSFRELLKNKLNRRPASSALVESIKSKLHTTNS